MVIKGMQTGDAFVSQIKDLQDKDETVWMFKQVNDAEKGALFEFEVFSDEETLRELSPSRA